MQPRDVETLARVLREQYSPTALDPGVSAATVVEDADGFRRLVVPRAEQTEPWRSLAMIDARAVGPVLTVVFSWDDGADDGTVFVLPVDTRDVDLDVGDDQAVTTYLSHLLEFTLGGDRTAWEAARSTPLSPGLAVVRPW